MGKKDDSEIFRVEENRIDVELALQALHYEQLCNRIRVARSARKALDLLFHQNAFGDQGFRGAMSNWRPARTSRATAGRPA
jgi:hypothetical protein